MATNLVRDTHEHPVFPVACSHPATPASNDPVRWGTLTGVALTDEGDGGNAATETTVDFSGRTWDLVVDDNEGTGIAVGDKIYYHDTGTGTGSVNLNNSATGSDAFFGVALEVVGANATTLINVMHIPIGGIGALASNAVTAGSISANAVTTAKIADANVTAAKLSATLKAGHVALRITEAREIATNDIINTAGDAGVLSSNTSPILQRVNGATDKKLRLNWASSNSDEVAWDFVYPADLDDTAAVVVHVLAAMAGATNTPVLAISYFEGLGDTNAGGNTAAVTGTSIAEYTVTIAAGDVGAAPNAASIGIVPGAHTTDALYIYAVWVTYTRK